MKRVLLVVVVVAVAAIAGCEPQKSETHAKRDISRPIIIDDAYDGKEISLYKKQELIVRLKANATTGYEWKRVGVKAFSRNKGDVLALVEEEYVPDNTAGRVGAGGIFQARFLAKNPGKVTVTFKYIRPWEGINKDAKTFVLQANVCE